MVNSSDISQRNLSGLLSGGGGAIITAYREAAVELNVALGCINVSAVFDVETGLSFVLVGFLVIVVRVLEVVGGVLADEASPCAGEFRF